VATALHVSVDDLRRWNSVDASARLQQGMTLQAFVPPNTDLSRVATVPESDVRVLPVGSEEFFASLEHDRGFKRVTVLAKAGDTLESIGKHYDVPARTMERANRRGRNEVLRAGEAVVVYVTTPAGGTAPGNSTALSSAPVATTDPAPSGPLPLAPLPELLPP
jgi:membrane-bound lytic murein transglycosylase D